MLQRSSQWYIDELEWTQHGAWGWQTYKTAVHHNVILQYKPCVNHNSLTTQIVNEDGNDDELILRRGHGCMLQSSNSSSTV